MTRNEDATLSTGSNPESIAPVKPSSAPVSRSSHESELSSDGPHTNGETSMQQRERVQLFETSADLQELCRDNGITSSQFAKRAQFVTSLDMFLGFWPSMLTVMYFPALRELSITKHPTIAKMEGLTSCLNLETLSITECELERIEGLENCKKLRRLNLSSNLIRKMKQLEFLPELETLWLNDNRIEVLEGLENARKLTTLWVARNQIERIDSALNGCTSLTEMNIAGNRVSSFKSLLGLANLDQLAVLTLSDPHFGDNPVCRLCNYQTYLMCQLGRLSWLDTFELSARNKQIAEATMVKKKMYYNMRIKTIKRQVQLRIRHADVVRSHTAQHLEGNIEALLTHKKKIEKFLSDTAASPESSSHASNFAEKFQRIEACLQEKSAVIFRMNQEFETLRTRMQRTGDTSVSRLLLELETGGNIRLEDGKPTDPWYSSCVDLVRSRLFPADLRAFGISDVQVNRVTRINNRHLRNRFHTRMEEILVVNEETVKDNVSKKGVTVPVKEDNELDESNTGVKNASTSASSPENSLEYLFYVQPPVFHFMRNAEYEHCFAAENGFRDAEAYRNMGLDGAVKLSNSLALSDTSRLLAVIAESAVKEHRRGRILQEALRFSCLSVTQQEKEMRTGLTREMRDVIQQAARGDWEIPPETLLVVKVFPGYTKTVSASEEVPLPIHGQQYPGVHSLQVIKSTGTPGVPEPASPTQKMYYMFDKMLILPEYLVEYEYVSTAKATAAAEAALDPQANPKLQLSQDSGDLGPVGRLAEDFERRYRTRRPPSPQVIDERGDSLLNTTVALDENVAQLIRGEPLSVVQTASIDSTLAKAKKNLQVGHIKCLDLLGCGLEAIPDLSPARNSLEVLVLSNNRLSELSSTLTGLVRLTHVDLSGNMLRHLEHLETLGSLTSLDVARNQIASFDSVVYLSRVCKSSLRRLDIRKNPIVDSKRYRLHVLHNLSALSTLDLQVVGREEVIMAQQLLTSLSAQSLWDHFRSSNLLTTTTNDQSSATMAPTAAFNWSTVDELTLNRELITSIEGLDDLVNLRSASFADNAILKIAGLSKCTRLEDLSLEDNEISRIENLEALVMLKRLHLGRNRIVCIEQLDRLENLIQLSLEDNHITSLRGLGAALKLMELYIGNNRIDVLKEVQHLKSLPKLTILDLSGNEITRLPDYRLYTVYYLRRVKVLDGVSISSQDQSDARQKYSGKLTLEFIMEKCGGATVDRIQDLDLSSCRIRELGAINGRLFASLRELNLENNQIHDLSGLEALPKLRVLNLNRNRIEKLLPQGVTTATAFLSPEAVEAAKGILSCPKLEQLYLAYNQISDISALGLHALDELKVLHLQGNLIASLSGLDINTELVELRLDKNKIRQLDLLTATALRKLRVLSLDDNGLKSLSGLSEFTNLEFLDVSTNRLAELEEFDKLAPMTTLTELRTLNNPLAKKYLYRQTALFKLPTLKNFDGREVASEERERVDALFLHERATATLTGERIGGQLNLAPSSIPGGGKHGSSTMMIATTSAARSVSHPLAMGDVLAGSLLRKNPLSPAGFVTTSPSLQSVNTFPKNDQPTDATIVIAPSNTTIKGLAGSGNGNNLLGSSRTGYSASNQSSGNSSGMPAFGSASTTVTVASAFNASLSNTGGDHLNLSGLRSDRRRMTSIHYDPALGATFAAQPGPIGMVTGAGSLTSGIISSHSLLRGSNPQGAVIHPLAADKIGSGSAKDTSKSFSGYVVAFGNQKRYGSIPDPVSMELAPTLPTRTKSGSMTNGRPR